MNALGIKYGPQEWRLFTDPSKLSLKAVLLHNGKQHPSIPVGHAVHIKETYENLKQLLNKLECSKYGWHICGDLTVVSVLMGLQLGYTKYCCFLCEWDSRAKTLPYLKRDWPQRKSLKVGEKNVQHPALAEWHKILLPPLNIKFDLMKNSLDSAKWKLNRVFWGPQTGKLFRVDMFNNLLQGDETKSLGRVLSSVNLLPQAYRGRKLQGIDWGYVVIVSQTWLQYALKDAHASFALGFLPRQLRHG